ncbi:hypothetical protein C9374_004985 [Naegleria lovaniensis]|uniref:Adenylate and Guanylate cyclase catalytic domain containing protein n=1 Tax=Naegleria lovaniensis TaxID=51637 RepID=A0AA88GR75_NAELO|nr:uncharacterized protein C9374_004985 [Naegleria lovaniensis]KAG2383018.1 hypothetical protein C9374_004985 [Naegleria lovaniensis]
MNNLDLYHPSSFHGTTIHDVHQSARSNSFHHGSNHLHHNNNSNVASNTGAASSGNHQNTTTANTNIVFLSSTNPNTNAMEQKDVVVQHGAATVATSNVGNNNIHSNVLMSSWDQPQHSVSAGSGISSGNNHNSSSTSISSQGAVSFFRHLVHDKLLTYLAKSHSNGRIQGWKWNVLYGFLHLYYLYASVVLALISTYGNSYDFSSSLPSPYGYYAGWLFRALTYPITFSLDDIHVPYELLIVLAVIMMLIVLVLPMLVVWSATRLFGKSQTNLKRYAYTLALAVLMMAPLLTFILTSFFDCNLSHAVNLDNETVYVLNRVPTIPCYASDNIILLVLSFLGLFALQMIMALATYILPMTNGSSSIPFVCESNKPTLVTFFSSISLRMTLAHVIPPNYMFGRAIIHMIFSLLYVIGFARSAPFFRRVENSFYIAMMSASLGSSTAVLISSLVNPTSNNELGLYMMALTVALPLLLFIISFACSEILWMVSCNKIRQIFKSRNANHQVSSIESEEIQSIVEKEGNAIYSQIEQYSIRSLQLYLRFSVKSNADVTLALPFIKAVQKHLQSPNMLLSSALIVAYHWNDSARYTFAIYLLKRALKHSDNILEKLTIKERIRELEMEMGELVYHSKFSSEVKQLLTELQTKQEQIKSAHRLFWKEMTNEVPNEDNLYHINSKISEWTRYCDSTFYHLMRNCSTDKTVLRRYAGYLENVKFDIDFANKLYEDASHLEEEEAKNIKGQSQVFWGAQNRHSSMVRFRNRVAPASQSLQSPTSNNLRITANPPSQQEMMEQDLLDDNFNGVDEPHPLDKRTALIRNSLNTPQISHTRLFGFLSLSLVSVVLMVVGLILGIYYGNDVSRTPIVKSSCLVETASGAYLRELRMRQIVTQLFTKMQIPLPTANTTERALMNAYFEKYNSKFEVQRNLLKDLERNSQSGVFTLSMYQDYTVEDKMIVVPVSADNSSVVEYTSTFSKLSSIREITQELIQHANVILAHDNSYQYNTTTTNYQFMYIFLNRKYAADAYYNYCQVFQKSQRGYADYVNNMLTQYFLISTLIFALMYAGFLIISRIEMQKASRILSIFRRIPKDIVGVVFQGLEKSGNHEELRELKKKTILSSKNYGLIIGALFLIVFAISIALIYVEINTNVRRSYDAMVNIELASLLIRTTNRITLRLNEMYTFFCFKPGEPINHSVLVTKTLMNQYRSEVRTLISSVQSLYNQVIFGTNISRPIIGTYPKIDQLIQGVGNCSGSTSCQTLQELISSYTINSGRISEEFFNAKYTSQQMSVFFDILNMFNMNDEVFTRLVQLLEYLVGYTSHPSKVITICFFFVGLMTACICNYFIYKSYDAYDGHISSIRSLLNYLPIDYIESNEDVKNFTYYNSVPLFYTKNKLKGNNAITNLLDSMVDGAILSNSQGEILLFNHAAQNLLGKAPAEVVGLKVFTLFDPSHENSLKDIINNHKKYLLGHDSKRGEVLELDCVRKNMSRFPVKANIFVTRDADMNAVIVCFIKDITSERKQHILLQEEKKNSENLLRNILPDIVASRLKGGETFIAEKLPDITVFFSDMVGFTKISSQLNPTELVQMLNEIVIGFDHLTDIYKLEKIKTIGDAYFCVGGLNDSQTTCDTPHPERVLKFAIETFDVILSFNEKNPERLVNIRVGINTGQCVAGVIGRKKFAFDLWGDTINVGSRMESSSLPGRIHCSRSSYERVYDLGYEFEERFVEVKGKGSLQTYLLKEKHHKNPTQLTNSLMVQHEPERTD